MSIQQGYSQGTAGVQSGYSRGTAGVQLGYSRVQQGGGSARGQVNKII